MFSSFIKWYGQTAKLVGYPVLFIVLITAIEKTMFTATCMLGNYQCQYSLVEKQGVQRYVNDLVTSEPKDTEPENLAQDRSR